MNNPQIIYEDRDVLIVNKPAGLLVHPTHKKFMYGASPNENGRAGATLTDWLLKKYPEIKTVGDDPTQRPGIVHRLDKETSGVMIVARNQKSFDYLKKQFQSRQIKKTYLALVWGKVELRSGVIEKPLGLKSGSLKRTTRVEDAKMVKEARTVYRVKKYVVLRLAQDNKAPCTLLEVEPLTGRTHQIRVHLASIHHPVVGDRLYSQRSLPVGLKRMFLHAESLELTLPNGSRKKFSAELDSDLKQFLPAKPD